MTEIIEPNPLLIDYLEISYNIIPHLNSNLEDFFESGEWHYVQSDLETNIFLLKRLKEKGLLPDEVNICDCGVGLGTVLFDLYLQSKELDNKFTFTGIEKHDRYVDFLNKELIKHWDNNLNLIHDDIMNQDYSKYNFIYFYQPFKVADKAMLFYSKIINEAPKDSIIIGLNHYQIQTYGNTELVDSFNKLKPHQIDDVVVFIK